MFGHQRLREKKYTAGQIDARWTPEIEQDYHQWLKENEDHLPAPKSTDRGDSERGQFTGLRALKPPLGAPVPRHNRENPTLNIENIDKYRSKNRACQSNFVGSRISQSLSKSIHRLEATAKVRFGEMRKRFPRSNSLAEVKPWCMHEVTQNRFTFASVKAVRNPKPTRFCSPIEECGLGS